MSELVGIGHRLALDCNLVNPESSPGALPFEHLGSPADGAAWIQQFAMDGPHCRFAWQSRSQEQFGHPYAFARAFTTAACQPVQGFPALQIGIPGIGTAMGWEPVAQDGALSSLVTTGSLQQVSDVQHWPLYG